mmetsp:Transcript_41026/g.64060  ORF Transcript_41026/g.64060 Transcript_41026/m.64060 type:complete len:85 (-) Transcript_41026:350-604(-)
MSFFPALRPNPQAWFPEAEEVTPEYYSTVDQARLQGLDVASGQVLLCSNFHWFCNAGFWNGGLVHADHNARLFLNFAASSCRAL